MSLAHSRRKEGQVPACAYTYGIIQSQYLLLELVVPLPERLPINCKFDIYIIQLNHSTYHSRECARDDARSAPQNPAAPPWIASQPHTEGRDGRFYCEYELVILPLLTAVLTTYHPILNQLDPVFGRNLLPAYLSVTAN
jgi:hypothetical protein